MKKNIIIIVLSIVALLLAGTVGYLITEKVVSNKDKNDSINDNNEGLNQNDIEFNKEDIYGYGIVSYYGYDATKSYFKIVEFHKNSEDLILVSNDKNTEIWDFDIDVQKNRLYFGIDSGYAYSEVMYIDLDTPNREKVKVFDTKQVGTTNCKGNIRNIEVTSENIYFRNRCNEAFKYEISTNTFHKIEDNESLSISKNLDSEYSMGDINFERLHIEGKELVLDRTTKEITYDGKVIYTSTTNYINLQYTFEDDIVISERTNCNEVGCNTFKYYKYNFNDEKMIELDITKNEIYSKEIYYKNN